MCWNNGAVSEDAEVVMVERCSDRWIERGNNADALERRSNWCTAVDSPSLEGEEAVIESVMLCYEINVV